MNDTTPRKTRCRMLTLPYRDHCANEAVTPFGLCASCLAAAAAEFRDITAAVLGVAS